jgi:hypothetical protein
VGEDQQNAVEIGLEAMSLQLDETRHRVAKQRTRGPVDAVTRNQVHGHD